jgi:hypothetical protein
MKKIKLEALGIETTIPDNQSYIDDGFQESLFLYEVKVLAPYIHLTHAFSDNALENDAAGTCFCIYKPVGFKVVRIGYCDLHSGFKNLIVRAHEETHALEHFEKTELLESIIREKYDERIQLSNLDPETIAQIGSLYALAQYQCFSFFSAKDFKNLVTGIVDEKKITEAHEIFQKSMKKLFIRT